MRKLAKLGPILTLLVSTAVLRAETAPPAAAPPAAAPPAAAGPAQLAIAPARARAAALEKQISADTRTVMYLRETARKAKDVIKLNCVNDRLVQVNAELNLADTNRDELQDALAQDHDTRHSLLSSYEGHAQAITRLKEESVACIGEPELYKQESGNSVEHPEIPDDPGKDVMFPDEIEPPGYASPYS